MQTSASLLQLLKSDENEQAWQQLVAIYEPLIRKWLVRLSVPQNEISDVAQEIMVIVVKKVKGFEHNSNPGAFRSWLKNITRNCVYQLWRNKKITPLATGRSSFQDQLKELSDETSDLSRMWNQEYDSHVLRSLLKMIEPEFKPQTWQAFKRVSLDGYSASEVASELGITKNAVFIAKSRVLARLRSVGKNLIDE